MVDKLPAEEILGVTVVLVTCSYREREFVRIGYYVNNEYIPEVLTEDPEEAQKSFDPIQHLGRVQRQILADKPRVTKFPIPWGDATAETTQPMDDHTQQQNPTKDLLPMHDGTPSTAASMEMDD